MKCWLNGRLLEESAAAVAIDDHGLVVGDGVFETVKVVEGQPFALRRHLDRLRASGEALGLAVPPPDRMRAAIADLLCANAGELGHLARLRLTVTGGPGPLGSGRGDGQPTVIVATAPISPWEPLADVVVVPWPRNERGAVAGVKTTSYAENVRALAYAHARGASEAVFANTVGELCEGTGSNVFVVLGERVVTPPLSSGCLAGVTRALLLEWTRAEEEPLPVEALGRADEVFLASTTRDVQPVRAVDGRPLPTPLPGPVTRELQRTFAERSGCDPDP